jgi:hypothetical protein
VLGIEALDEHDLARAEAASAQFDAELWRISDRLKDEEATEAKEQDKKSADAGPLKLQVMPDASPNPLVSNLSVMSLELRGGLLMAKKLSDDSKKLYAQAAREENALGYRSRLRSARCRDGSGGAYGPVRTGATQRQLTKCARRDLRSGFPPYGIAIANEQAADIAAATAGYADFLAVVAACPRELLPVY